MAEDKKTPEGAKPAEGIKDLAAGDGSVPPTPEQLKVLTDQNADLTKKLGAQENQSSADRRKLEDRIKTLETEKAPPEDSERIANLEVELARSKAVSLHGLSVEDAALLKGSPDEILADAEYWAKRVRETDPKKEPGKSKETNREIIDKKVETGKVLTDAEKAAIAKPTPKPGETGTWLERYQAADPRIRSEMDSEVQKGLVDPTK